MIKIIKVSAIVVLGLGICVAQASVKKYEVKSGKIEYSLKGGGNILGMTQINKIGKKRVIFDNYGVKNLEEKVEVEKQTTMGKSKTNKTHSMIYMNDAIIYRVDFEHKRTGRNTNSAIAMGALFGSLDEGVENVMKKMGGKKVGTEKILGYTCDIWDIMGSKQCIYKGVPLKLEVDIMGMKTIEIATKVEFDISLNSDDFKLPDFPIYGDSRTPIDRNKLEEMDKKDNAKAKLESAEASEAMKGMAAGFTALANSGYDVKSSKELTPEQEEIMQKAMMTAMGGEGKIVAKMKKEMLENVKQIEFAEKCFGDANTLSDVNRCVDKGNKMFYDDKEYYTSWTAKEKQEELQEIKDFKKAIPCIRAAKTMTDIKQCLPYD